MAEPKDARLGGWVKIIIGLSPFQWLDWQFIAHWPSLIACLLVAFVYAVWGHATNRAEIVYFPIGDILLVGFSLWIVVCALRGGYSVG